MSAIGCFRNKRSWLDCFESITVKQLSGLVLAEFHALVAKLSNDPSGAVTTLMLTKNIHYLFFHCFVFIRDLVGSTFFPRVIATAADLKHFTEQLNRILFLHIVNEP